MELRFVLSMKVDRGHEAIYAISSEATLEEAAQMLVNEHIGAAMVFEAGVEPTNYVGIVSERDILRKTTSRVPLNEIKVGDVMTREMVVAQLDDEIDYVLHVMSKRHIRHIPVMGEMGGQKCVVGFLSIRDLLYAEIDEKEIVIQHLNDFLGGTYANSVF